MAVVACSGAARPPVAEASSERARVALVPAPGEDCSWVLVKAFNLIGVYSKIMWLPDYGSLKLHPSGSAQLQPAAVEDFLAHPLGAACLELPLLAAAVAFLARRRQAESCATGHSRFTLQVYAHAFVTTFDIAGIIMPSAQCHREWERRDEQTDTKDELVCMSFFIRLLATVVSSFSLQACRVETFINQEPCLNTLKLRTDRGATGAAIPNAQEAQLVCMELARRMEEIGAGVTGR